MPSTSNVSSRASSSDRETVNDRERVPRATPARVTARTTSPPQEYVRATARSTSPPLDYVRSAVLCMLRRVHDVNLPSLSSYLAKHFPLIPPAWRDSIIVAAFTGAQKAAVSHTDAVLQVDQERSAWAKASLPRWAHGLSAVEPGYISSRDSSVASVNSDCFSPDTNLLLDRQVPVGVDSSYAVAQAEAAFEDTSVPGDAVTTTPANQPDQLVVSSQLTLPSGDQAQLSVPAQVCLTNSSGPSVNLDCYSPTTNFLLDRQVPVGVDSSYAVAQAEAAFEDTSVLGDAVTTIPANQLVVSSQLTLPSGDPAQLNDSVQSTVPESQVNASDLQPTQLDVPAQLTASEGAELTTLRDCSKRGDENGGLAKQSAATVPGGDHGSEVSTEPASGAVRYFSDLLHVEGMHPVLLDDLPQLLSPIVTPTNVAEETTSCAKSSGIPPSDSAVAPRAVNSILSDVGLSETIRLARKKKMHASTGKTFCWRQGKFEEGHLGDSPLSFTR